MITTNDPELEAVAATLHAADPEGWRFARAIRRAYDQIYDGGSTGRFRWEQLSKVEQTHFGSFVKINLLREFSFDDGILLDYRIAGVDVHCKWLQTDGEWMLSSEATGQICLLITGSDQLSVWSAGLMRADERLLNSSINRDDKRTISASDRPKIHWIWKDNSLIQNVLLHIDATVLQAIMMDLAGPQRQQRLNELFRRVQNRIISQGVCATVAQQDDHVKRVRAIGRSRQSLKAEGIIVLGDRPSHRKLALHLGLPPIGDGDSMSTQLIRTNGPSDTAVQLGKARYRLCLVGEEPTKPAPDITLPEPFRGRSAFRRTMPKMTPPLFPDNYRWSRRTKLRNHIRWPHGGSSRSAWLQVIQL